jgi:hypothetical protein
MLCVQMLSKAWIILVDAVHVLSSNADQSLGYPWWPTGPRGEPKRSKIATQRLADRCWGSCYTMGLRIGAVDPATQWAFWIGAMDPATQLVSG